MDKKIQRIFLYFVPTIIVVLLSVYAIQQNTITADVSSDVVIEKIELSSKYFTNGNLPLVYIFSANYIFPIIKSAGGHLLFKVYSNKQDKLIAYNNNSPPKDIRMNYYLLLD